MEGSWQQDRIDALLKQGMEGYCKEATEEWVAGVYKKVIADNSQCINLYNWEATISAPSRVLTRAAKNMGLPIKFEITCHDPPTLTASLIAK